MIPHIAIDQDVTTELAAESPVAIGVSGGKDSQAAVIAAMRHLDKIGHTGPRVLIHADLGSVEWDASLDLCREMAEHFGLDLIVVSRKAGGLMERWESRWLSSRTRYELLETVTLVPCWSTPSMRFCTSEMKTHVITAELSRRFPGRTVINITGVRREESAQRAKQPISDRKGLILNWRPVLDWTTAEVFDAIRESGLTPHQAYTEFGMTRVSCRFCIMSSLPDLIAASLQPESHDLFRRMVRLEAESSFAFQGSRWLGDVAPQNLTTQGLADLAAGKERARERQRIESSIPKNILYVSGWPTAVPTPAEARILADARREMAGLFGFDALHTDAESVIVRYQDLMAVKAAKDAEKAVKEQKRRAKALLAA